MLQETQRRLEGLDCGPAIVVCNVEHRFMVADQLRGEIAESPAIILEPAGRNTAPAILRPRVRDLQFGRRCIAIGQHASPSVFSSAKIDTHEGNSSGRGLSGISS